jgi:hypothetical protein
MMTVNSTNYDNVCQQLICFMLSSPITTKNENNRIQCKHSNLWFGTITNIHRVSVSDILYIANDNCD